MNWQSSSLGPLTSPDASAQIFSFPTLNNVLYETVLLQLSYMNHAESLLKCTVIQQLWDKAWESLFPTKFPGDINAAGLWIIFWYQNILVFLDLTPNLLNFSVCVLAHPSSAAVNDLYFFYIKILNKSI